MLFRFKVKRLQVKWYLCFQSLNYAVLFLGEMIAGEMVHLLSVTLCCFVQILVAGKIVHHFKNSAFSRSMMFDFKVKWLQV